MRVPGEINLRKLLLIMLGLLLILIILAGIAVFPIIQNFQDFFVNGFKYDPEMKLFMGFPDKEKHFSVLEQYYDNEEQHTDLEKDRCDGGRDVFS